MFFNIFFAVLFGFLFFGERSSRRMILDVVRGFRAVGRNRFYIYNRRVVMSLFGIRVGVFFFRGFF